MGVLGIPLCYKYVWSPLHHLSVPYMVPSIAREMCQFLLSLTLFLSSRQEDASADDDSYHEIIVYVENSVCNDLPTTTTVHKYNETFPPPELIPVYMLEHSTISFHASTNQYVNTAYFYVAN